MCTKGPLWFFFQDMVSCLRAQVDTNAHAFRKKITESCPIFPLRKGLWDSCCEWQEINEAFFFFVLQWRGVARQQKHDVVWKVGGAGCTEKVCASVGPWEKCTVYSWFYWDTVLESHFLSEMTWSHVSTIPVYALHACEFVSKWWGQDGGS